MSSTERILHNYFRSSSSYRVRIALNLKGLPFQYHAVHLNRNGGEQFGAAFQELNAQALVPVLEEEGALISQSLAILEYLDERYPQSPLLPTDPFARAHVRQLANTIACEMHPINNLRVLKYLTGTLGLSEQQKKDWIHHWNRLGLQGLEQQVKVSPWRGRFLCGDTPGLADCCLVPQLFNAQRFEVDLTPYPMLRAIAAACEQLEAFAAAHPARQPDAE
ncbi:maleylacetoacetate isomerase [Herbaspirillum rubrisubalbicans]|uniref:Maleylacetoacetate isomerase n=1 Tax=Herbaspirillum rubrisubalbicans TaxID=80842 RepID=A0ABX9BWI8_9BURK|nr:maleylacetoacetate isomerase [Herbaspirillum rubrisubalbicans]NQE48944.1 maleylacetoacetate isomerase [Herbaspirillum rubrisubalbicans]RAM62208.1 maleylacetoacetate isomerase [Herbaspirillum rubrisubalbicans]RAN50041.1 maleylacetoacetate isomerase [Herbaspirillum rubrisubalbicans]